MKVIVRCANNRVTKAEMEREIERLFQENKDLRLSESHLRDELNLSQQQSEARRQVICERDKLIQELNDQIAADEEELANAKASAEIQRGFREEMAEEIEALEKELAKSESESSQGMNAMVKFWEEAVKEKNKAEERAEEYRIALMESDCRVDELKKQLAWVREEVARLTTERDTSVSENSELIFTINELQDKWETEHNLRANAEKERDMYRSSAEAWHAEHDKVVADVALYREKAGKYLDERNRAWDTNRRLEGNEETITYYQEIAENRKEKLDEAMHTITSLNDDIHELEETIDGLNEDKRAYGEEIDRLRKVVIELQTNRFTTDEFIGMIMKNFMPSADK